MSSLVSPDDYGVEVRSTNCPALMKSRDWVGGPEWFHYPEVFDRDIVSISDAHIGMTYGENIDEYPHKEQLLSFLDLCLREPSIGMIVFNGDVFDNWAHSSRLPAKKLSDVIRQELWFRQKIFDIATSSDFEPVKCVFLRGNHDDDLTADVLREMFVDEQHLTELSQIHWVSRPLSDDSDEADHSSPDASVVQDLPTEGRVRGFFRRVGEYAKSILPVRSVSSEDEALDIVTMFTPAVPPARDSDPGRVPASPHSRALASENVIFGGDVFVLPSLDGLIVFTHGHLGDAWNCRYWTQEREPYGRFLTALAASVDVHEGPKSVIMSVLQPLFVGANARLVGWGAWVAGIEQRILDGSAGGRFSDIATEPFYDLADRDADSDPPTNQQVREALEVSHPLSLDSRSAVPNFHCIPRLNAVSLWPWIEKRAEMQRSLSVSYFLEIPELLYEMFLPGAVAVITGHVHGPPRAALKTYDCECGQYRFVEANSGDWHPTTNSGDQLGGICIQQKEREGGSEDYTPLRLHEVLYSPFIFQRDATVTEKGPAVRIPDPPPETLGELTACQRALNGKREWKDMYWYHGLKHGLADYRYVVTSLTYYKRILALGVDLKGIFERSCSNCVRLVTVGKEFQIFQCRGHDRQGRKLGSDDCDPSGQLNPIQIASAKKIDLGRGSRTSWVSSSAGPGRIGRQTRPRRRGRRPPKLE